MKALAVLGLVTVACAAVSATPARVEAPACRAAVGLRYDEVKGFVAVGLIDIPCPPPGTLVDNRFFVNVEGGRGIALWISGDSIRLGYAHDPPAEYGRPSDE